MKKTMLGRLRLSISAAFLSVMVLTSSSLLTPQNANAAGLPVINPTELIQTIQQGIQRVMDSQIMQTLVQAGMDLKAMLSELEVDTINNAFANMIARTNQNATDIQNLEQVERAKSAKDVCQTIQLSTNLNDMLCQIDSQRQSNASKGRVAVDITRGEGSAVCDDSGNCTATPNPPSVDEVIRYNNAVAKKIIGECSEIKNSTGKDLCGDASLAVLSPLGGMDKHEYKAALKLNELAAGISVPLPRTEETNNRLINTPAHDRMKSLDFRDGYYGQVFKDYLDLNTMLREGTLDENDERHPGEIINLDRYLSTRLGSQNWLCEISNVSGDACKSATNPDGEPLYVAPAELEKRKAQMDAVGLHIGLQQYKSMLRIERLLADIALMKLNPPGQN